MQRLIKSTTQAIRARHTLSSTLVSLTVPWASSLEKWHSQAQIKQLSPFSRSQELSHSRLRCPRSSLKTTSQTCESPRTQRSQLTESSRTPLHQWLLSSGRKTTRRRLGGTEGRRLLSRQRLWSSKRETFPRLIRSIMACHRS